MINKELFEGPVGDYCIARNTIKCLFYYTNKINNITMIFLCCVCHVTVIKKSYHSDYFVVCMVPGQVTPIHLTPGSSHPIFGQVILNMK